MIVGFAECLPAGLPNTPMPAPRFYAEMKKLPAGYGVFESGASRPQGAWRRYFQTQYELTASSGLSSRVPVRVLESERRIAESAERGEWSRLCKDLGFRYILLADTDPAPSLLASRAPILAGDGMLLFDCHQ